MRKKWNMDTVSSLWGCLRETWVNCAPSGDRVLGNVEKMALVLKKIIAAHGGVVPDEFYRTGRVNNKGDCEHKPRQR